jgi:DinB superfamily
VNSNAEPKLAPPGAGLPPLELFIGRLMFTLNRWTTTLERSTARFQCECEAIRALTCSCDEETGAQRVLIARPHGLEDSSRYWSVWMTLDHLRIVHHSFVRVIRALTNGIVPPGRTSTAEVKPSPGATRAVLAEYEQSCDELLATVDEAPSLNTRARYAHPWFGPLNAAGWHALSGGHLSIHRVQIERILAGLSASPLPAEKR